MARRSARAGPPLTREGAGQGRSWMMVRCCDPAGSGGFDLQLRCRAAWQVAVQGLVDQPGARVGAHVGRGAGEAGRDHGERLAALAVERSHRISPIGTAGPGGAPGGRGVWGRGGGGGGRGGCGGGGGAGGAAGPRGGEKKAGGGVFPWRWLTRRNAAAR